MFPLWMAFDAIMFHIHATPFCTVYKQSWGILEPQVKSFRHTLLILSHPLCSSCSPINFPFPPLNSTVPSLRVTCSFSPAPSCVPRPFQLLGSLVLTVYCPPLSLLRRSHAATTHFTTDIARFHGASILVVTAHL